MSPDCSCSVNGWWVRESHRAWGEVKGQSARDFQVLWVTDRERMRAKIVWGASRTVSACWTSGGPLTDGLSGGRWIYLKKKQGPWGEGASFHHLAVLSALGNPREAERLPGARQPLPKYHSEARSTQSSERLVPALSISAHLRDLGRPGHRPSKSISSSNRVNPLNPIVNGPP